MMKKLIIYIGTIFFIFNSISCLALEEAKGDFSDVGNKIEEVYKIKNLDKGRVTKKQPLIKSNKKIATILILPYLADRIYEGDKINDDLTPFLEAVYPNTDIEKLKYFADVLKAFVIVKRFYVKSINKLRYHVNAKNIFPKDAPIIAKEGEYAKEYVDLTKQTTDQEYKIYNKPYKYIEYDRGDLGEPVRMMDKNYTPSPDVDELTLAIFEFNIPNIIKALEKMPEINDGSFEKAYIGDNNLSARILFDTSLLGDKEEVLGVLEVNVPKGFYINGDFLNKVTKPKFVLKEDGVDDYNIKDYQFFMPLPLGIQKNNKASRLLLNVVKFPFSVKRKDVTKAITVAGDFYFELCDIANNCKITKTEHKIRLKPSLDEKVSLYNNYVTQAHTHLPSNSTKYAKITNAFYDKDKKVLDVVIKTDKKISNVAVMVEDENKTNFLNPRYQIKEKEIIASFDVVGENAKILNNDVGISVLLDDFDVMRNTILPEIKVEKFDIKQFITPFKSYLLGVLVVFMSGGFYLFLLFTKLIANRDDRYKIFARYVLGATFGVALFSIMFTGNNLTQIYINPWLLIGNCFLLASLLYSFIFNFNFILFRPLKKFIKYGFFSGLLIVWLGILTPFYESFIESITSFEVLISDKINIIGMFLAGMMSISLFGFVLYKKNIRFSLEFKNFNLIYILFYVAFIFWILFNCFEIVACLILIFAVGIIGWIWYNYPMYIQSKCEKIRNKDKKEAVFRKIQYKTLALILGVYVLTSFSVLYFAKKDFPNPSIDKAIEVIKQQNDKDMPVLVAVESDWSIEALYNRIKLNKLLKNGMSIIFVNANIDNKISRYWLDRYNKNNAPLYILFTKRHNNGLVLPINLNDINFNKAVMDFIK